MYCKTELLLFHSENYRPIKLTFVVISHKIFLARLFCAPCLLHLGATAPLSYATEHSVVIYHVIHKKLYYRRGITQHAMSVEILLTVAQLCVKLQLKRLAVCE